MADSVVPVQCIIGIQSRVVGLGGRICESPVYPTIGLRVRKGYDGRSIVLGVVLLLLWLRLRLRLLLLLVRICVAITANGGRGLGTGAHGRSARLAHEQLVILAHRNAVAPTHGAWIAIASCSVGIIAMVNARGSLLVGVRVLAAPATVRVGDIGIIVVGPVAVVVVRHGGRRSWTEPLRGKGGVLGRKK